jgi:hypothetical protein
MRLIILTFVFIHIVWAQTLPTLPAIQTIKGTTVNCTLEALDAGGLSIECAALDGTMKSRSILEPTDRGVLGGHAEILVLYWTDSTGKNRLQVANDTKLAADGYMPAVTARRRWRFWR